MGLENKKNLIEEFADVGIMIEQVKILCGIGDFDIDEAKRLKCQRQLERIEKSAAE